jgi:Mannitol dehydrogenase C-terminal domain
MTSYPSSPTSGRLTRTERRRKETVARGELHAGKSSLIAPARASNHSRRGCRAQGYLGFSTALGCTHPPHLFLCAEFPRTLFDMNSPHCINPEAAKGHDYYPSLPALILGSVLSSQPTRSVLPSLGLAAVCNVGRILIQWVVDASQIKGVRPDISGVTYVEDPLPYIERKLLTVNTGHSAIAYLGYGRGRETIHAALEDDDVRDAASKALEETGLLLAYEYGFDPEELREYRQKCLPASGTPGSRTR